MDYKLSIREGITFEKMKAEIEKGGRFIVYQYCLSLFFAVTLNRLSPAIFLMTNEDSSKFKRKYNTITYFFGWWGLPWGPIHSIKSIMQNNKGGIDVTQDVMLNITKESFESRMVCIEKMATIYSKPSGSDLKAFVKVADQLKKNADINTLFVGLFINTDEYTEPYYVIAISGRSDFETNSKEVEKILYTVFRKHVPFNFINLDEPDDVTDKMIEQGEKLI